MPVTWARRRGLLSNGRFSPPLRSVVHTTLGTAFTAAGGSLGPETVALLLSVNADAVTLPRCSWARAIAGANEIAALGSGHAQRRSWSSSVPGIGAAPAVA